MLQAHQRVGDFEIIRLLGKGGMGEVYESLQFNPERRVALKVLAPWLADDDQALERFWREARVPANLDHPGIVRIISTGKTPEGVAYYTMYLVRGVSLAELIRRANAASPSASPTLPADTGPTPSAAPSRGEAPPSPTAAADFVPPCLYDYRHDRFLTVARLGVQAARALTYAHEQGHLHRDIKPSNLMVDVHNQVYLVDFGLTRALQPADGGTHSGAVAGTPWYMSPEQAAGKALDERSDIYSLGVALYELATQGLGPFTASRDNKEAVLAQVRAGQVLPLRALAPGIPWALEQIVLRAMQHKPKRRYTSAAELTGELEAFLGSSSKPSQEAVRKRAGATRKRRRAYLVAVAVPFAVALAVAPFAFRARSPGPGAGADVVDTAPAGRKLDGTRALPESLRTSEKDVDVRLFNNEPRPRWSERILGSGKIRPAGKQLELPCFPPDLVNALAIADPDCSCFEFSVELMQMKSFDPGIDHELGIFFGQSRDSDRPSRCFLVQLDERPVGEAQHGRLTLGTAILDKGSEGRAETLEWPALPPDNHVIRLSESMKGRWHVVKVRVQDQTFFVSVDGQPFREYLLREFRNPNGAQRLTLTGAVGLWSRRGMGLFRDATLTLLSSEIGR
jgi:serine/threonine protein kinase